MHEHERAGYQQIPFSMETTNDSEDSETDDQKDQTSTNIEAASNPEESDFKVLEEKITSAAPPPPDSLHSSIHKEFEQVLNIFKLIMN